MDEKFVLLLLILLIAFPVIFISYKFILANWLFIAVAIVAILALFFVYKKIFSESNVSKNRFSGVP